MWRRGHGKNVGYDDAWRKWCACGVETEGSSELPFFLWSENDSVAAKYGQSPLSRTFYLKCSWYRDGSPPRLGWSLKVGAEVPFRDGRLEALKVGNTNKSLEIGEFLDLAVRSASSCLLPCGGGGGDKHEW